MPHFYPGGSTTTFAFPYLRPSFSNMQLPDSKKIYFLSDFHLGAPEQESSLKRERAIVSFLEEARKDAAVIFILGDLFDFWYEYKRVIPKGHVRILGKLAELSDSGIKLYFFTGNHDMWMNGYFEDELGIEVFTEPKEFEYNGVAFLIGHGDGLGPGDHRYKFLKKVFRNRISRMLFGAMHPSWGIGLANYFSRKSRAATGKQDEQFLGEDKEWLIIYCKEMLKIKHYDYFLFGHRHLPMEIPLEKNSTYINIGDWINHYSYACFDGKKVSLLYYQK